MEKMYRVTLSEEQLRLVSNCVEDVNRFASGQPELWYTLENMLEGVESSEKTDRILEARELLKKVKEILLPELRSGAFKGYNTPGFIGNTYQIYRTILHQLTVDNNINNTYSSPTLPSGNMGTIKVEKIS